MLQKGSRQYQKANINIDIDAWEKERNDHAKFRDEPMLGSPQATHSNDV
jgi:hypothetical protein